jgi:hypothetical protein
MRAFTLAALLALALLPSASGAVPLTNATLRIAGKVAVPVIARFFSGSFEAGGVLLRFGDTLQFGGAILLPTVLAQLPLHVKGVPWAEATNMLTANGASTVTFVSPLVVTAQGLAPTLTFLGELDLEFVPEPATALLFGWGLACLSVAARRNVSR